MLQDSNRPIIFDSSIKRNAMTTSINKTETFVIETWINCKSNVVRIYLGSDSKHYYIAFGIPLTEIDGDFVKSLIWLENNRAKKSA